MREFKVAICEDLKEDSDLLNSFIKEFDKNISVTVFDDGELFLKQKEFFSIVFLDIYMNKVLTGIDIAKLLREENSEIDIVFTTRSKENALEGFGVNALQYLIKPVDKNKVWEVLTLHRNKILQNSPNITVVYNNSIRKIYIKDILYVELQGKNCYIHLYDEVVPTHMSIKDFATLLSGENFVHSHHSYIANLDYVVDIDSDFIMENSDRVYIKVKEVSQVKKTWNQYMIKKVWKDG